MGLLPGEFFQSKWNIFDTIIVLVSLVELNLTTTSFNVSGLRALRVVSKLLHFPFYENYHSTRFVLSFISLKILVF